MPELPDILLYRQRLEERLVGETLNRLLIFNPFTLRSTDPSPSDFADRPVLGVSRLGKRIVLELSDDHFVVIHLMISGRFQWQTPLPPLKPAMGKVMLAAFRFGVGQLSLVEMSTKKRASIHLVRGRENLAAFRREGIDLFAASGEEFCEVVRRENRTLKRALTDPQKFDGIGNAYSDEILYHAQLSPVRLTQNLTDGEIERLRLAAIETMELWIGQLEQDYKAFPRPNQITAFRPDFCAHGRYGQPCRRCGLPIQRIVHAENETNYCAQCQNEGRLLADRSLSRLLKSDWPKTLEELLGRINRTRRMNRMHGARSRRTACLRPPSCR